MLSLVTIKSCCIEHTLYFPLLYMYIQKVCKKILNITEKSILILCTSQVLYYYDNFCMPLLHVYNLFSTWSKVLIEPYSQLKMKARYTIAICKSIKYCYFSLGQYTHHSSLTFPLANILLTTSKKPSKHRKTPVEKSKIQRVTLKLNMFLTTCTILELPH